jgi:phage shock protein A
MKGKVAPMSVMKRVSLIFKSKANRALDRMEDPRETLDYSYQRQLDMLTQVRRGVADVATSRKRVELQMNTLQQQQTKLEGQAKQALGSGREDLAREASAAGRPCRASTPIWRTSTTRSRPTRRS